MKRVISILVLLLFISVPFGVTAERIDFSGLSLDGLIMLKTWINEEIAARTQNGKEVCVPVGEYIVGADIPAGSYSVTYKGSLFAYVYLYTNKGDLITFYSMNENETIGKINLEDGQIVQVLYGPVYFSIYKGLGF